MSTLQQLSDATARERIAFAVSEAERGTSGEIVPCVVERSDDYEESVWLAALIGAGIALLAFAIVDLLLDPWGLVTIAGMSLIVAASATALALLAAFWPRLRVLLAGRDRVDERTRQAAIAAFVAEGVFATKERTGILLFLSVLEHRVVVLGDTGINNRVEQRQWDEVVRMIIDAMHAGRPVDAVVEAIARCGEILCAAGCTIAPGDVDELPNSLRIPSPSRRGAAPADLQDADRPTDDRPTDDRPAADRPAADRSSDDRSTRDASQLRR